MAEEHEQTSLEPKRNQKPSCIAHNSAGKRNIEKTVKMDDKDKSSKEDCSSIDK